MLAAGTVTDHGQRQPLRSASRATLERLAVRRALLVVRVARRDAAADVHCQWPRFAGAMARSLLSRSSSLSHSASTPSFQTPPPPKKACPN